MKFEEGRWGTWLFPIIPGIISTMKFMEIQKAPKKGGGFIFSPAIPFLEPVIQIVTATT
ncbi:hypothetical protein ACTHRH_18525 [Paenibacillus sp. SAFN-117]